MTSSPPSRGGNGPAAAPRGCRRRPGPESAIERVYAAGLSVPEAELVLAFYASHYPLTMEQQLDETMRLRRVSSNSSSTSASLSTPV